LSNNCQQLSKSCYKVVKKLSTDVKKMSKNGQKWQKVDKNLVKLKTSDKFVKAGNSEEGGGEGEGDL
jgi:hypothetical protein